ncbi:hypothetical protein MD484_g7722, partial [Candolleomyces efflorescens]
MSQPTTAMSQATTAPTTPSTTTTIKELLSVLQAQGVRIDPPGAVEETSQSSVARAALSEVEQAIASESWTVMHSGAADYILAGPLSVLSPDNVAQAVVDHKAKEAAAAGEDLGGRRRFAGGFSCTGCGKFNTLHVGSSAIPSGEKWCAVFVGTDVGVFQGAHVGARLTSRVSGGMSVTFTTKEDAERAFQSATGWGCVKKVAPNPV